MNFFRNHAGWIFPVILVALLIPWANEIDLLLQKYFFLQNYDRQKIKIISDLLQYPGIIVCLLCGIWLLIPFEYKCGWKKPLKVCFFSMIIGRSGLIVNLVFKQHYGRPRPKQVIQFGGTQRFQPFYLSNWQIQHNNLNSFPSGHSSTGFYFFSFVILGHRYKSKKLFYGGLILAIFLGGVLGWTRMALGAHFFSDNFMSAIFMWLTAYFCDRLVHGGKGTFKSMP